MKEKKKDTALPTVVTDLNGDIIHINTQAARFLCTAKAGDSIGKYIDLTYIRKLSLFDNRIDTVKPIRGPFNRAVIKVMKTGAMKTVEVNFFMAEAENEEPLLKDKRLCSTYAELIGSEVTDKVRLKDLLDVIISSFRNDLRFAYRKFDVVCKNEETELYVNFRRLITIVAGTIVAFNEIEYRNPIKISTETAFGQHILKVSVNKNTFLDGEGLCAFSEAFPRIAMRMNYITTLCDNDNVEYKLSVKPNSVSAEFVLSNMLNKTGRFSTFVFNTEAYSIVSHVLDLFVYDSNDTSEEEPE